MAVSPEQAAENAAIRDWARANGFSVSDRGALPKGVKAAYDAAVAAAGGGQPAGQGGDGGPDWGSAAAELGIDPAEAEAYLSERAAALEGGGQAAAPAPPAEPGTAPPRPPVDLAEARERIGAQPRRPAWAPGGGKPGKAARPQPGQPAAPPKPRIEVTPAVRRDIEGKIAMMIALPVASWEMADSNCGGAAARQAPEFCRALAPIICQSPDMVEWFSKGTTFMLWIALAKSLQPVGAAIWRHHIAPQDGDDKQQGQAQGGPRPPAPDNSAYPTVTGHVPPVPRARPA